ncbi:MAG TPA: flavin reductase family protein [Nocardioides sp.]
MSAAVLEPRPSPYPALGRVVRPLDSGRTTSPFRDVMAHLAAPVCVVTTGGDEPSGTTVSAVMSLSMQPELIGVSLARTSASLAAIRETGRFGVNLMAADQVVQAMVFARSSGAGKLQQVAHRLESGIPRLLGTMGWVRCRVDAVHGVGDHLLVVGAVESAYFDAAAAPSTYFGRTFGTHVPNA